jgi:hypothetical protein
LFIFVFGVVAAAFFIIHPSGRAILLPPLRDHRSGRGLTRILLIVFAICLMGNLCLLLTISSADVQSDSDEIGFYLAGSAFWLALTVAAFEFVGISIRDDVAGRRNPAAAVTICGLLVGEAFCLGGSHTGNGPGAEVVLACAAISTAALFVSWALLNAFSGIADRVSIERDLGSGIRSAGFLGGGGAILGASVAGDWISVERTLRDFARFCWPILVLLMVAVGVEVAYGKRRLNEQSAAYRSAVYGGVIFALCVIYAVHVWGKA